MSFEFGSNYCNRPKAIRQGNFPPSEVETSGYLTTEQRVSAMMMAGAQLLKNRKEQYDINSSEDDQDPPVDPTRSKGFDLAEASEIIRNAEKKARILAGRKVGGTSDKGTSENVQPDANGEGKNGKKTESPPT